jgi:hypothetical protein
LVRFGSVWFGLVRFGSVWFGSFWNFLQTQQQKNGDNSENNDYNDNGNDIKKNEKDYTKIDPFVQHTDLLISYHGEGDPKCATNTSIFFLNINN